MKVGISPFGTNRAVVVRLAAAAVDAGLDTLWIGDGLLENSDFPMWFGGLESFTELAWLGGMFPQAALGCSAAVLPLRDPLWLAKQAATLDQLTEGRFTLVVAPGFWEREFIFRGLDFDQRGAAFDLALDRLRAALAGAPEAAEPGAGPSPGRVSPPPIDGGPPLWLAGGRLTLRRALARGLPFQASRLSPDGLAPWAAEWHDAGGGVLAVRARMEVGEKVLDGDAVEWRALVGPPSFLAENLHAYAQLGVADVSVVPSMLPNDEANSLATIEALASAVAELGL